MARKGKRKKEKVLEVSLAHRKGEIGKMGRDGRGKRRGGREVYNTHAL